MAIALGYDRLLAGDEAVSRGWLARAGRLIADAEPCPEQGWLAQFEAHLALLVDHNPAAAELASAEAVRLGRQLAAVDLEMAGMAYRGLALVSQGSIGEGMRLLDEATAAALAGEVQDPDAAATCCCALIYACERVHDYPRAAQWCQRLKDFSAQWSYQLMLTLCRTHYAGVLIWRGLWAEAEAELHTALETLEPSRPGEAAEAVVRLAELRCWQGRLDESAALFARTETGPLRAQGYLLGLRGRAELALAHGDPQAAADLAERYLRAVGRENRMARSGALGLLARAHALTGALPAATAAAAELAELAAQIGTEPVLAAAHMADGAVRMAGGEHEAARRSFEDAVDHYERSGGAYAAACARVQLAEALVALGRDGTAAAESQAAYRALSHLGATRAAGEAAAVLRRLAGSLAATVDLGGAHLTPREIEVLRLLARGRSNQDMAVELVLSTRTVERHIGNIYGKLGITGGTARAAATAFALNHGIG